MTRRTARPSVCPLDGKTTFRRWSKAAGRNRRLNGDDGRVYWCAHAGGWHVTHTSAVEYQRRRSA